MTARCEARVESLPLLCSFALEVKWEKVAKVNCSHGRKDRHRHLVVGLKFCAPKNVIQRIISKAPFSFPFFGK